MIPLLLALACAWRAPAQHTPVKPVDPTFEWKLAGGPAPGRIANIARYTRRVFTLADKAAYKSIAFYGYFGNDVGYEVSLNGKALTRLTWADIHPNSWPFPLYLDLTTHAFEGENTLAIELLDRHGTIGSFRIEGETRDGRRMRLVVTDEEWKTTSAVERGWQSAGYNDGAWPRVGVRPFNAPVAYFSVMDGIKPLRVIRCSAPGAHPEFALERDGMTHALVEPGSYIVLDFGRTLTGKARVWGDTRGFAKLHLACAETAEERNFGYGNKADVEFGPDLGATLHRGIWTGRFVKLELLDADAPVNIDGVTFDFYHYPVEHVGRFDCSDPLLNDIWECMAFSARLCILPFGYVDGAWVERGMWIADFFTELWGNWAAFGDTPAARATLDHFARPGSKPKPGEYMQYGMQNNDLIWVLALANYLRHTGDMEFARKHLERLRFTLALSAEDLDGHGIWSMKGPLVSDDGNFRGESVTGKKVWPWIDYGYVNIDVGGEMGHTQGLFVWAHREAAWILDTIGEPGGDAYGVAADEAAAALNARMWDADAGLYVDARDGDELSTRHGLQVNMLAILSGAADEERRRSIYERMLAPDEFMGSKTPYYTCYSLAALSAAGHPERALKLVREYFGGMVGKGATSCWEMYLPGTDNDIVRGVACRSKSHAWGAGAAYWLTANVLGVRPLEPGYAKVSIRPELFDLDYVYGVVPTPHGPIAVDWPARDKPITVKLPAGVTAVVGPERTEIAGPGAFEIGPALSR